MDDEGSAESGGLARASDEAISKRRIVTARGSKRSATSAARTTSVPSPAKPFAAALSTPASTSSSSTTNPFATFGGLTTPAPPAASANPFAAFKGLTSTTPAPSATSSFTAPASGFQGILPPSTTAAAPSTVTSKKKGLTFPWIKAKVAQKSRDEARATCLELLNKEFYAFVQQQVVENPMALWTTAIHEYIHHVESVETDLDVLYGPAPPSAGKPLSSSDAGFTFGVQTPSATTLPTPPSHKAVSGFTFGANPPAGFTFGATNDTPIGIPASAATQPPVVVEAATKSSALNFGQPSATIIASSEPTKATASGFHFGAPAASTPPSLSSPSPFEFGKNPPSATGIVIRNSIGKIMLNAGLFAGMTVQTKPKSVLLPLMHEGKIANFLFGIPPARIPEFKAQLDQHVPK
ncbi:hypothetical protein DYB25_005523 [Aphanomyces astaci]|uniref:RanBD1 domain-containing protein n=1 Tax=Aphanomyces astaci TaxID=112090 RepID=A0A397D4U4_APHAT|nr:hypothetical protein DYB25_005523 [Aphanomyces astaci]RHY55451.1 hypothetical protein DYB38_006453 [Aphanomyces astaci]RHY64678.1 hypothetical protein DYB30_006305 [Aphanomyces astaci]RHZ18014.1 hypothetical protein DYB31_002098 [Aphanomyces astaci]RHZ32552.1 hypothetical protein DYB26_003834 [Aphanomyces astaci]